MSQSDAETNPSERQTAAIYTLLSLLGPANTGKVDFEPIKPQVA